MGADLTRLTRLTSELFEAGSFVIPASLQAGPLSVTDGQGRRVVQTDDVAQWFGEILTLLNNEVAPTGVSIGALQALEGLARVLNREAAAIEFSTADSYGKPLVRFEIGEKFIVRAREVLGRRRPSQEKLETLEGPVTALDVVEGTLLLTVEGVRRRVKGNFSHMFTPSLLEAQNRRVTRACQGHGYCCRSNAARDGRPTHRLRQPLTQTDRSTALPQGAHAPGDEEATCPRP